MNPGRHYIVARWPFFQLLSIVQVAPGREVKVMVVREGPANQAREQMLDVITQPR